MHDIERTHTLLHTHISYIQNILWLFTHALYIHTIQIVEEDVEGYVSVVEGLEQEAKRLIHFDSTPDR